LVAVRRQGRQSDPIQNAVIVFGDFGHRFRWSAIQEMNPPKSAIASKVKATHTVARDFRHVNVPSVQRKAQEFHEPFMMASQVSS
jgi:hypothetical protein